MYKKVRISHWDFEVTRDPLLFKSSIVRANVLGSTKPFRNSNFIGPGYHKAPIVSRLGFIPLLFVLLLSQLIL